MSRIRIMYRQLSANEKFREFVRFIIVGILATCIHYGMYLLLIHLVPVDKPLWTNLAYAIGYLGSWCCNLWLTAQYTFHQSVTWEKGVGFALCHIINFGLHALFLNLFLFMGIEKNLAPLPVYSIVVPINFVLVRFVFKRMK